MLFAVVIVVIVFYLFFVCLFVYLFFHDLFFINNKFSLSVSYASSSSTSVRSLFLSKSSSQATPTKPKYPTPSLFVVILISYITLSTYYSPKIATHFYFFNLWMLLCTIVVNNLASHTNY